MSAEAVSGPLHKCIEYLDSVTTQHVNVGDYFFYAEVLKYISSVCFIYKVPDLNQEHLDRLRHACEHFKVPPVDTLYDLYYYVDLVLEFRSLETEVLHDIYTCSNFGRVREYIDTCSTEKIQELLGFCRNKNQRVVLYIRAVKGIETDRRGYSDSNCYVSFLDHHFESLGYIEEAQNKVFYDYIGDSCDTIAEYGSTYWWSREEYALAAKTFEGAIAQETEYYNDSEKEKILVQSIHIFTYCSVNRIRMSQLIF